MNLTLSNVTTPALALAAILAAGCSSSDDDSSTPPSDPASVTAGVDSLGLTTLASVLTASGLDTVLEGDGPFTLLAPTNAAFDALDPATLAFLTDPANVLVLEDALRYHVLDGAVSSTDAAALSTTNANNGDALNIETVDGSLYLNDAGVANADVTVDNGLIHVVDSVLLPPMDIATALAERGLDNLAAAAAASTLDLSAAPITVLAPSDASFEALAVAAGEADFADFLLNTPQGDIDALLNAHIVSGAGNTATAVVGAGDAASAGGSLLFFNLDAGSAPTVDGIDITAFNVPTTQSLVHEIADVITVRDSVVDVATAAGLTTLVGNITQVDASQSNDLAGTIGTAAALTVFAPSEAAWADAGLVNLQDGSNDALLEQVLRYHVVADAIQAKEIATLASVDSLDADPIAISVDATSGVITLTGDAGGANEAMPEVTTGNVFAVNAVVHVIDTVLIPPGVTLP